MFCRNLESLSFWLTLSQGLSGVWKDKSPLRHQNSSLILCTKSLNSLGMECCSWRRSTDDIQTYQKKFKIFIWINITFSHTLFFYDSDKKLICDMLETSLIKRKWVVVFQVFSSRLFKHSLVAGQKGVMIEAVADV